MHSWPWPLEWFFDGKIQYVNDNLMNEHLDPEDEDLINTRVSWKNLQYYGWDDEYLRDLEAYDLPDEPGIYAIIHDCEAPTLYVGQSKNIRQRIRKISHHKVSEIVRLFEFAYWGQHNSGDARSEIRVFWKTLPKIAESQNLDRWLIWCESVTIGLLCPLMQGNVDDIWEKDWAIGRSMYS